jgi:predicted RNase H-like HicB family nuclease
MAKVYSKDKSLDKSFFSYRAIIEPDTGNTFHAYIPTLPGCHTWGSSIKQARKHLREAALLYLASLLEDKERIPQEEGFEFVETFSADEVKVT